MTKLLYQRILVVLLALIVVFGGWFAAACAQRDLQVNIRLDRPIWRHCPAVLPAVTGVKDQNLCLLVPVCGCFCLSELPVSCKPAAKHHNCGQQYDQ